MCQPPQRASPPTKPLHFSGRDPDETKVFTNGRRIHIVLSHYPAPPHGPDPEYIVYSEESDEQVIVVVRNITPPRPAKNEATWGLRLPDLSVELTIDLEVSLGNRTLRCEASTEPIPVTAIATRLEPTRITKPWSEVGGGWQHGLYGFRTYGPVTVGTWPITHRPRLHGLRQEPYETVTIRNPDDGVALLPSPIHYTTVGFEEMGWYYKLTAPRTTERNELVEFARAFERPAISGRSFPTG